MRHYLFKYFDMKRTTFIFTMLLIAAGLVSRAGGYQVSLHGQKQIGMGLIGTSLSADASCLFYNPGALGFVKEKLSFSGGMSVLRSMVAFQYRDPSTYTAETDNPLGTPFYFYGAGKINERLSVGLAINTPYGNSLEWEKDWAGRYLIESIKLKAIFFQPSVSYKINDKLGIGAGFVYATGDVDLTKRLPVAGVDQVDGTVNIKGATKNYGFNVGILYKPTDKLQIGIDYRSQIDMNVEGADVTMTVPSSLSTKFPGENKVDVTLPLPANLDIGASYQFNEKLMLGFSLNYVFWGVYDSLIFDFENNTDALADSRNPRDYSNTLIFRAGGEYNLNKLLTIRAGGYFDPSPASKEYFTPETPSLDNLGLSCGLSIRPVKNLSIDLSFLYLMGKETKAEYIPDAFGGTYKSRFYIPGFGFTYSL